MTRLTDRIQKEIKMVFDDDGGDTDRRRAKIEFLASVKKILEQINANQITVEEIDEINEKTISIAAKVECNVQALKLVKK